MGFSTVGRCALVTARLRTCRLPAALLVGVCLLSAACATTPNSETTTTPLRASASAAATAPAATAALEGLLPNPADVNTTMGATGMTVSGVANTMWDDSAEMKDADCRFADGPAMAPVYAGSGFTAVRGAVLQEPGDTSPHYAGMTVVAFPSPDGAASFFTDSAQRWPACSNRQYTDAMAGSPPAVWTVGPVTHTNGILSTTKTQLDVNAWACQRALTVRNNVAIDVIACSTNPSTSAVRIAHQIAAKVP
jgi:PknH-like extracellular domain